MIRLGGRISTVLLQNEHIATISQQAGRAESGEDTWGPNQCEFHVELKPGSSANEEEVQAEIRKALKSFPGIQSEVVTFLGDRISETISGETAQVVANVFGDDLDALDAKAREVADVLRSIPGAEDVQLKSPPGSPLVTVRLRPERLNQFGFRPLEVLDAVQTAFQGTEIGQIYEGNHVLSLTCILEERSRRDPASIGSLLLSNASGVRLPLSQLADVTLGTGRYLIQHEGARRRQTVTCNPQHRDIASFVADAREQIARKVRMPAGVYVAFGGAAGEQARARQELLWHTLLALAGITLVLSLVFHSARNLLLVLVNIPFALVGGVLAVCATGGMVSLGSLVGFVTLFGITMRNSIMMISHFDHLVAAEGLDWNPETALRGAGERLVPILMTALVTALGLLPLALSTQAPGHEIEGPMAAVILGGLISSTALNLLVLPSLAIRFGRFQAEAT
jgi:Cu/Ag efflux pump CusA